MYLLLAMTVGTMHLMFLIVLETIGQHTAFLVYRTGHYVQYDPESTKGTMNLLKHGGVQSLKFDVNQR